MKPSFFKACQSRIRRIASWLAEHPPILVLCLSLTIAFANEVFSRHSLLEALRFSFTKPYFFLCNMTVILVTLSLALLCRKRTYMITLLSLLWLGLGITNCVVRFFRQAPFSAMDFTLILSVFPILFVYLTWVGVVLLALGILALLVVLIVRFVKAKKNNASRASGLLPVFLSLLLCVMAIGGGYLFRVIPSHFSSLITAYHEYGFSFSFIVSALDRGIDKPEDYDDRIEDVLSELLPETDEPLDNDSSSEEPTPSEETPNVIFVQLESFVDVKLLKGFTFSEDPTPIFSSLKSQYQSGFLTVPSIGAGTANTEFEVLSGMSLQWFGAGEYPYETILQKKTCETVCYNLKNHHYSTHAVHNYNGNFYDRNDVFSRLGFDTFTSLEYMNNVIQNPIGWPEDGVLIPYVLDCLTSTEGADLVYCITVQGHGKYPQEALETDTEEPHITLESWPEEANTDSFSYYVNQLHETDTFIGALISAVKVLKEPTVIVFFGDHLPNIGIEESWLPDGMTLYNTEYVLWYSEEEKTENKDLTSYQLSAEVMAYLGFDDGILTKLHQEWAGKDSYLDYLEMLEYDLLYGDCLAYEGELPFEATDLVMGIRPIAITATQEIGDNTYILGQNFTPSSRVVLNGLMRQTTFINETTLVLENISLDSGDTVRVIQVAEGIFRLSETEEFICD